MSGTVHIPILLPNLTMLSGGYVVIVKAGLIYKMARVYATKPAGELASLYLSIKLDFPAYNEKYN